MGIKNKPPLKMNSNTETSLVKGSMALSSLLILKIISILYFYNTHDNINEKKFTKV